MCRQDWCREAVREQTLGLLSCVAASDLTERALFTTLAQAFRAAAAGHVRLEPVSGSAMVTMWTSLDGDLGEPGDVLERLPQALPVVLRWQAMQRRPTSLSVGAAPAPGEATASGGMSCDGLGLDRPDIAHVPLYHDGSLVRAAVLVRSRPFDRRDLHVLDSLRDLISGLARLAGEHTALTEAGPAVTAGDRLAGLTTREIEVLRLVSEGLLATTIAVRLDVSPRTVHKHLGSIYRKLDAHDRLLAVRRAETMGLLERHPAPRHHDDEVVLTMRW